MSEIFERQFQVGWRDVDPNGHVANIVYLEYAVDTRIAYFASQEFQPDNFIRQEFGPVIKSDLVEYFREAKMLDELTVTNENGGHSEDFSRFRVVNNIYSASG
ncbi:MAG: thioesterase family protein, partial [Pyrinomonadaceae bacterium]